MIVEGKQMVEKLNPALRGGEGTVKMTALLTPELMPEKCRLFSKIVLEQNCGIGYHVHEKETEIYYITGGKGVVDDNGTEAHVAAGDVVVTPNGYGHSIKNVEEEALEFTAVIIYD